MARSNEQTKSKPQLLKSSSFAWDKAFFTSDGVLDADELSSIIEGDTNNVKHQLQVLQPIQDIENLEAKLFQEIEESSTKKPNKIKTQVTQPTTSKHNSPINNVKSSTTISRSKTGKSKADSPSKSHLLSHISPRTSSPGSLRSPGSPKSSPSTSSNNKKSSRNVPRRSSSFNSRRKDEQKPSKQSINTLKNKSSPVNSHHSSPLGLSNSSSSTSLSSSSSTTHKVKQRSISTGRGTTINHKSLTRDSSANSSLKTRPTSQTTVKQSTTLYPRTKTTIFEDGKIQGTKKVQRSSSPKPSRGYISGSSKGVTNIFMVSPEVMDIKGKLNALKMEINMQKKEKCKETKMVPVKISKSESSSSIFKNTSSKMNNQARRT